MDLLSLKEQKLNNLSGLTENYLAINREKVLLDLIMNALKTLLGLTLYKKNNLSNFFVILAQLVLLFEKSNLCLVVKLAIHSEAFFG